VNSVNPTSAIIWGKVLHLGAIMIPVFFLHFVFIFLEILKEEKVKLIIAYLFGLGFQTLNFFTPWFTAGTSYRDLYSYPTPGVTYLGFFIFFVVCVLYALLKLYFSYRIEKGAIKNQLAYLLFGSIIGYLGGMDNFMITIDLRIFPFYPFGAYAIALYVFLMAYAITKHELMDIRVMISRTMAYGASIFTILLLGAGAIYINTTFFHNIPILQFAIVAVLALTAIAIFEPIRKFIQTPLEEKWITGWYDPTKVINRIAEKLVPVLEKEETFKNWGCFSSINILTF